MAQLLTADQMSQVFKARPDVETSVAATKKNAIRETTNWWNKFGKSELGANFFTSNPATAAYSAGNITAAATAPAARPDDLLGIRSTIQNDLGLPQLQTDYQNLLANGQSTINTEFGLPQLQTDYQNLYKQYSDYNANATARTNAYDQETDTGQLGIMNQQKTMGVLRGESATQSAQRALGQSALARELQTGSESLKGQLDVLTNKLNMATSGASEKYKTQLTSLENKLNMTTTEASDRYNIRASEVGDVKNLMLQFPDAGIGFGDSTESMAGKIKTSNERKVVTDMFTQTFGYFPENQSMASMNKALAKKYKSTKAYEAAKNALALANVQSTIDARVSADDRAKIDAAKLQDKEDKAANKEAEKKAQDEVDARSKFLDGIVGTYITKVGKERRQSAKDSLKEEARKKIEAQYPGWGWVASKIG